MGFQVILVISSVFCEMNEMAEAYGIIANCQIYGRYVLGESSHINYNDHIQISDF